MWTRILKSLAAIFSGQVIIMLGNLLLVPLFLTHWSPAVYGEWLALFSLVGYLSTLDLGINMAVTNRLTQAYARGDMGEYSRCQHSALAFYLCLTGGASVLLAIATWTLPLPSWLGLRNTPAVVARLAMWLLGLQVLWAMPIGLIVGVYRTTGNLARSQWLGNLRQVGAMSIAAAIVVIGGGMMAVSLGQLLPLILVPIYVLWDLHRNQSLLMPALGQARFRVIRELVHPSLLFGLILLAMALTQQGPVIAASSALGGVAVAVFVTTRTLANLVRQVVNALGIALWPDLTGLEARQENARLRAMHRLLVLGSTGACIAVGAALWYEGSEVFMIWTRHRLVPDQTLLRLLLVQLVLGTPWLASGIFTLATSRHTKLASLHLSSALVGLGLMVLLMGRLETWAIPLGLMAGEVLACYHFVPRDTCAMLDEPYGPFVRRVWLGLPVVVMATMAAGWLAHLVIPGPCIIRWFGVGVVTATVSLALTWGIWLSPEDRVLLQARWRLWWELPKA